MHWFTLLRGRFFFVLVPAVCTVLLTACAHSNISLPKFGPAGDAMRYVLGPSPSPRLLPGYEYLQVSVHGRQTLLVRAPSVAATASDEYWYSAQSEMLQLRHGRLWRVLGMTTEWRDQVSSPPTWQQLATAGDSVAWRRQVNRMPGYRWQEIDHIQSRPMRQAPNTTLATQWPTAQWFEEDVHSLDGDGRRWVFKQRFAVHEGHVVFSEQCIAPDLCLQLTRLKNPS